MPLLLKMWLIYLTAFIILDNIVVAENSNEKGSAEHKPLSDHKISLKNNLDEGNENRDFHWPMGIVSYYLDHSSYDYLVAERVRLAMNTIEEASCVRFKALLEPYSKSHWIHITNKARLRGCVHDGEVNGTGYETVMTMGLDCMQRRDILHLLMHALGFKDEVTHPLRDNYVRILWDNIHPAYQSLFRIRYEDYPTINTEYDPTSIMHFHDRAYTKNGQATIASLVPGLVINPSRELSPLDKMKLRSVFGRECNRRKVDDLLDSCKAAMQENNGNQEVSEEQSETDVEEDHAKNLENNSNQNDMNNHENEENEDTTNNEEEAPEQTVVENNDAENGADK